MSTLFLIDDDSIFSKIASMARKFIITIEGETTKSGINIIGRNYSEVFRPFGFVEVEHQENIFNMYGHLRVLKRA